MIAIENYNFTIDEIKTLIINGFKSAFLPYNEKKDLLKKINFELNKKGIKITNTDY